MSMTVSPLHCKIELFTWYLILAFLTQFDIFIKTGIDRKIYKSTNFFMQARGFLFLTVFLLLLVHRHRGAHQEQAR